MIVQEEKEIETLREGGKRLRDIREKLAEKIVPGARTDEIDRLAGELFKEAGGASAFKGYRPEGAPRPYPAETCISINDVVVHGIPIEEPREIKEGDVVSLDVGLTYEGLVTDTTTTVYVGDAPQDISNLINTSQNALQKAIETARAGVEVRAVSSAIEEETERHGYGIPDMLGGHGVGRRVHEPPFIPNVAYAAPKYMLSVGEVIAIEPIITLGSPEVVFENDGYTVRTRDGSPSAEFEATILITEGEAEILT